MSRRAYAFLSVFVLLVSGSPLVAQVPSRISLHVQVLDTVDHPIVRALILVASHSSGAEHDRRETDKHGAAVFYLSPGDYDVQVRLIGHSPQNRSIRLGTRASDTLRFVLALDPTLVRQLNEERLLADKSQPRLAITQGSGDAPQLCDGVDSLQVVAGIVTVTGFRSSPVTPAGVFGTTFRRRSLLLLDLFDQSFEGIGSIVNCVRWRAMISHLPPGRYLLTVRHMTDHGTQHLLETSLDTRKSMAVAVPPN